MTLAATERLEVTPTERRAPVFGELALVSALVSRALADRSAEPHAPQQETVLWSDLVLLGSVFARLAASCGLDEAEAGLVVLAVAPAVSHRLATGYALLRHDPDAQFLSPSVAMQVLGIDGVHGVEALLGALQPGRALVDLELVHVQPGGVTSVRDNIVPSSRLLAYVLGDVTLPADVGLAARIEASHRCPEPLLGEAPARHFAEALAQLRQAVVTGHRSAIPVCVLIGREGTGRGLCALHLAKALGQPLMRVDVRRLPDSGEPKPVGPALAALRRVVREARIQGALLYLDGLEGWNRAADHELRLLLETYLPTFALGSTEPLAGRGLLPTARPVVTIPISLPDARIRTALWQRHLPRQPPTANGCIEVVTHKYRLTGGQIVRIAALAAERAIARGRPEIGVEEVEEAVRTTIPHALTAVAREVRPTEGWDDLIVPEETRMLMRVMMANYRHRRLVYDEWGFGKRFGRGLGLSALLTGPPGTGKTMAAGIVAKELGLPLYQVELSRVVSKWVGETEKNLDEVFAEAEACSAVVLFDEADSLFAKRTEVSSANDRYANLEVNHLLQRIESFEGIVLLTTNNAGAIDRAFLRRFGYQLQFPLPNAAERALLWEGILPAKARVTHPIDFDFLAKEFEFSGGHIKNAVLRAAFFAAELDRPIDERLLSLTGSLELKQLGSTVRHIDVDAVWRELGGKS